MNPMKLSSLPYNAGRRCGVDRRIFTYAIHLPEQRSGKDRRRDTDRGNGTERKNINHLADDRKTPFLIYTFSHKYLPF